MIELKFYDINRQTLCNISCGVDSYHAYGLLDLYRKLLIIPEVKKDEFKNTAEINIDGKLIVLWNDNGKVSGYTRTESFTLFDSIEQLRDLYEIFFVKHG